MRAPCVALCLLALAGAALAQKPTRPPGAKARPQKAAETDWAATVAKAHGGRRVMLRRAAARKVADAGDAAIAAVRAYAAQHGRQAISLELVTSYATSQPGGPATLDLLRSWAEDRDFYWRAQALEALANRRRSALRPLFTAALADASYLTRIQGGRGLCLLDVDRDPDVDRDKVLALLRDPDPRARVRIAICLVETGDDRGLPTLVEALRQDAMFLDYPWGALDARAALSCLRKRAATDFGYAAGAGPEANRAAIAKFEAFARARLGERWTDPVKAFHDTSSYLGGLEIRSCRNGDVFLRFATDRRVVVGLEARTVVPIPAAAWSELWQTPPADGVGVAGKVVCDYLRIMCKNPTADRKFAPGALAKKSEQWLSALAVTLEKNGGEVAARRLRSRLEQFTPPR